MELKDERLDAPARLSGTRGVWRVFIEEKPSSDTTKPSVFDWKVWRNGDDLADRRMPRVEGTAPNKDLAHDLAEGVIEVLCGKKLATESPSGPNSIITTIDTIEK